MTRFRPARLIAWLAGAVAGIAVLAVAGAFIYIHFVNGPAPAPLTLPSARPAASAHGTTEQAAAEALPGRWTVTSGSVVGYRVHEVLAGQSAVAVGRTSSVTGSIVISGTSVTSASFTADLTTVHSNESQRDAQFNGRIMNTAQYPVARLVLTAPIALAPVPSPGLIRSYHATATLTMHGVARKVTFALQAERTGRLIEVSGAIPILFADWNIANPSFPPFVTTQNNGELEFLIRLSR